MSITNEIKEDIMNIFAHDINGFDIDISDEDIFRAMMLYNIDYDHVLAHLYRTIISELYIKHNNL